MVEIGVYSTVGTSETGRHSWAEFSAESAANARWKVCGNGCGMGEKRRERCSEDGMKRAALKFQHTAAEKFGTIQTSGPKAQPKGSRASTERLRPLQFTGGVP